MLPRAHVCYWKKGYTHKTCDERKDVMWAFINAILWLAYVRLSAGEVNSINNNNSAVNARVAMLHWAIYNRCSSVPCLSCVSVEVALVFQVCIVCNSPTSLPYCNMWCVRCISRCQTGNFDHDLASRFSLSSNHCWPWWWNTICIEPGRDEECSCDTCISSGQNSFCQKERPVALY